MKSAELQIDLDAILYNVRHLKCYYQKNVIAVLKDNAYGLGLLPIAKALQYEDNIVFALSDFNEIKLLRENNINNRIIYLNVFDENDLEIINKYNIDVIVQSIKQYEIIKNKSIPFHVKVNTGMNRLGLCKKDFSKIVKYIKTDNNLTGIMTHFANDDACHESYLLFEKFVKALKRDDIMIHCFASSSLNERFDDISNYIRIGIKLYGIGERNSFLHNALTLTSPILTVKRINKFDKVGYDLTFQALENGYLYILPIGYGQGWGRFTSSFAFCNYSYLKQAGKISMDYSTYYSKSKKSENEIVELFGNHISIESIAKANNMSPHEIIIHLKANKKYIKKTAA